MNCPKCNHIVKDTAKFCENCGAKIEVDNSTIECPSCHVRIPKDSKFCPDCGKEINSALIELESLHVELEELKKKLKTTSGREKYEIQAKIDNLEKQSQICAMCLLFS